MAKEYVNSRIWNIRNFKDAPLENYGKDFIIVCNENKFYLCFEPDAKMKHAPFCAAIYLFREQPRVTPVNVLWSICLINDSGVECFSSEIHTYFDGNIHQPMMGGVYNLNRKCVLNSSHGLLYDGNLTVKCSYQLETLKRDCVKSLITSLTVESVAAILTSADMHSVEELKLICIEFIQRNSAKVIATDGWKQMAKQMPELVVELYEDIAVKKIKLS